MTQWALCGRSGSRLRKLWFSHLLDGRDLCHVYSRGRGMRLLGRAPCRTFGKVQKAGIDRGADLATQEPAETPTTESRLLKHLEARYSVKNFVDIDDIYEICELEYDNSVIKSEARFFRLTGRWYRTVFFPSSRKNLISQRLSFGGGDVWLQDDLVFQGLIFREEGLNAYESGSSRKHTFVLQGLSDNPSNYKVGVSLNQLFSAGRLSGIFVLERHS
jgi:hypothetical protein